MVTSDNPFSELLREAPVVYIQDKQVFIPSQRGEPIQIVTPQMRINKPFELVGTREEFERDYFRAPISPVLARISQQSVLTSPDEIFFHNLIQDYLENKPPMQPIATSNHEDAFLQKSPLKKQLTVLTPTKRIHFGGTQTNQTDTYLYKDGEIFPAKLASPLHQLDLSYAFERESAKRQKGPAAKYAPVFDTSHTKAYFGENAINRKIQVRRQGNAYRIFTHCPKSRVKFEGISYTFEPVTLSTDVHVHEGHLQLYTYPRAPRGYDHLFVHASGTICYGSEKRFKLIGLTTSTAPLRTSATDITNPETANRLKKVLDEGHQNLHFGDTFATTTAVPVSSLSHRRTIAVAGGLYGS